MTRTTRMSPSGVFLAGFVMIGLALPSVFGCMCQYTHPQTQFCNADVVIVGTIQTKQLLSGPRHPNIPAGQPTIISYKVKVNMVKKGQEYEGQLWNDQDAELVVNTTATNVSCGVPWLEVGRKYMLTVMVMNGKGSLQYCRFHRAFAELTNMQRRGFNGAYNRDCAPQCEIYTCHLNGYCPLTPPNDTTCMHGNSQSHEDCYYQHSYCRTKLPGTCGWKTRNNIALGTCLQEMNQVV